MWVSVRGREIETVEIYKKKTIKEFAVFLRELSFHGDLRQYLR